MPRHLVRSMRPVMPLALLPVALIACAHQRAVEKSSGTTKAAVAEANGIRVMASANAWKGSRSPSAQFTPIQVSIENHSGRTLSLAYHDFSLTDQNGAQYLPLVAMRAKSREAPHESVMASAAYQHVEVYAPTSESCGRQDRLADAPYQAFSYTGPLPVNNVALSYAGPQPASGVFPYASTSGDSRCPEQLPTPQMVTEALPEKPLAGEARAEGFVYFQAQGDRGSPARLTMNLVDAATGQSFGLVQLNFAAND